MLALNHVYGVRVRILLGAVDFDSRIRFVEHLLNEVDRLAGFVYEGPGDFGWNTIVGGAQDDFCIFGRIGHIVDLLLRFAVVAADAFPGAAALRHFFDYDDASPFACGLLRRNDAADAASDDDEVAFLGARYLFCRNLPVFEPYGPSFGIPDLFVYR